MPAETPVSADPSLLLETGLGSSDEPLEDWHPVVSEVAPIQITPAYETYWRFACERQRIYMRRLAGEPAPWTSDQVLKLHRFTNAYRASDRVSQYLIKQVIYLGDQSPSEVFSGRSFFECSTESKHGNY